MLYNNQRQTYAIQEKLLLQTFISFWNLSQRWWSSSISVASRSFFWLKVATLTPRSLRSISATSIFLHR